MQQQQVKKGSIYGRNSNILPTCTNEHVPGSKKFGPVVWANNFSFGQVPFHSSLPNEQVTLLLLNH